MKKTLRVSIFVILLLLLVAYVTAQFFLGSIIKATVNKAGPGLTQSKVELADASLSPLTGTGTLLSVGAVDVQLTRHASTSELTSQPSLRISSSGVAPTRPSQANVKQPG